MDALPVLFAVPMKRARRHERASAHDFNPGAGAFRLYQSR